MKLLQTFVMVIVLLLLLATPAFAAYEGPAAGSVSFSGAGLGAGLGMGLTIMGAALGLGKIGAAALESMARQPEIAGRAQTAMIIIAAMLEGATLASVLLCFLIGQKAAF